MRAVDIIAKKRDGKELSKEEITWFINGIVRGDIPDYQASAWLMAAFIRGLNDRETIDLTLAVAHSGRVLDLSDIAPVVVDKHSTGGVGDKTTLVVAPLVAAAGLPVGKMSGRGLGFSGGTLDKLESFRGFRSDLSPEEFLRNLREVGIVVCGQSKDLAPADGILYALRDVTATVESIPLIAVSIMSKKIATGAHAIVLDVKVGRGAFMKTEEDALELARVMVEIGRGVGRQVAAVLSDMNQPLGYAVGNAVEVKEAIDTLRGSGPPDFRAHCLTVAGQMLVLAGKYPDLETAQGHLAGLLDSGAALSKLELLVRAQGGDPTPIHNPSLLPQAPLVRELPAPRSGYLAAIDAMEVGLTAAVLGAGRTKKGEPVDHGVGIVLRHKIGDYVEQGEPLLVIHANSEADYQAAAQRLLAACAWSDTPVEPPPLLHRIIA